MDKVTIIIKEILQLNDNILFGYIFGSFAKNTMTKESDIDIAVYFKNYTLDNHLDIIYQLSKKLNFEVDLTILNKVRNIYLLEDILHHNIIVKDDEARFDFEIYKQLEVIDFKQHQAMINVA